MDLLKMGGCTITGKYNTFRNRNNAQDSVSVTSMTLLGAQLKAGVCNR